MSGSRPSHAYNFAGALIEFDVLRGQIIAPPKMSNKFKFKIVEIFNNECSVALLQELLFQKATHFLNSQLYAIFIYIFHDFHSHGQTEAPRLEPTSSFPQLDEKSCTSHRSRLRAIKKDIARESLDSACRLEGISLRILRNLLHCADLCVTLVSVLELETPLSTYN